MDEMDAKITFRIIMILIVIAFMLVLSGVWGYSQGRTIGLNSGWNQCKEKCDCINEACFEGKNIAFENYSLDFDKKIKK